MKILLFVLLLLPAKVYAQNPHVRIITTVGNIEVELFQDKSPITVENFLNYVDKGFYSGIIFHRIVPDFVVQAGGYSFDFQKREPMAPIENESTNALLNSPGTLSMARFNDPDSATSQFFINLNHNTNLDYDKELDKPGYTVFGRVLKGMDVVNKIASAPLGEYPPPFNNAPLEPIIIEKVTKL